MEVWVDPATNRIKAIYDPGPYTGTVWQDLGYVAYSQIEPWMLPHIPPAEIVKLLPTPMYCEVIGVNLTALKPLQVRKIWKGVTFEFWCYVTQDIKDNYVGGKLVLGDYVTIVFADDDIDYPLAQQKVFKTW